MGELSSYQTGDAWLANRRAPGASSASRRAVNPNRSLGIIYLESEIYEGRNASTEDPGTGGQRPPRFPKPQTGATDRRGATPCRRGSHLGRPARLPHADL